ncbi:MAG: hypothetical protein K9M45_12990, partial [Kiritimatiellales bacterium]|nr:hypothetical protein [Kiritimatiellales bacterium]
AYWWQNEEFVLTPITKDRKTRTYLSFSPDGKRLAVVESGYLLRSFKPDGTYGRVLKASPFEIHYDWAPDSRWLVCSSKDSWGNSDVWIVDDTGEQRPFNLSRHPNWDGNARWSPDGKIIAFVGRRYDKETDIFYVWLQREDEVRDSRDRKLKEALEAMESGRGKKPADTSEKPGKKNGNGGEETETKPEQPNKEKKKSGGVRIDFNGLAERIHRIHIGGTPDDLFWSFDSKALAFKSTINGKKGTYKVVFPHHLKPDFMIKDTGTYARWIKKGSKIMWLNDGVPAAYTEKYPFKVFQETNVADYRRLAFRLIWRRFRDRFYDPEMNNLDWEAVRLKYEDAAANSGSWECFERVAEMLMGELNASHIAFEQTKDSRKEWNPEYTARQGWSKRTAALGLYFDVAHGGPGLKVSHVVSDSAADRAEQSVRPGEILLAIDGMEIGPGTDLPTVLNGRYPRTVTLRVQGTDGAERNVEVEEESFENLRKLVRKEWMDSNRAKVEQQSNGRLGYLDIKAMDFASLRQFEKEIYARGFGKSGLVIDVRNNPGGFISDYLLAILCHPGHAVTVPRDGEKCYQQGYLPSAAWFKPIVVLCNEYSTSNAEIFSHAIKTMGRGKIVGVPTQRAVISTNTEKILDVGNIRMPHRGWFTLPDGLDMEHKPCVPDYIVRTKPGDIPAGRDAQLEKAVEVLLDEIKSGGAVKTPKPVYAAELRKEENK